MNLKYKTKIIYRNFFFFTFSFILFFLYILFSLHFLSNIWRARHSLRFFYDDIVTWWWWSCLLVYQYYLMYAFLLFNLKMLFIISNFRESSIQILCTYKKYMEFLIIFHAFPLFFTLCKTIVLKIGQVNPTNQLIQPFLFLFL